MTFLHPSKDTDKLPIEAWLPTGCVPVAKQLSATQQVLLHFASSTDICILMPEGGSRIVAPAGLCQAYNVTYVGKDRQHDGDSSEDNALLQCTSPVLTWHAPVGAVKTDNGPGGKPRRVAVVDLAPHRYPAPSWWKDVEAFIPTANSTVPAADHQPDSYVSISGQQYRLASIPTNGSQILVDVTQAKGRKPVAVGDTVCVLCADHPVGDLADEIGADGYNTALCLTGQAPVVGSSRDTPECTPKLL